MNFDYNPLNPQWFPSFGCGDFQLKAKDGSVVCGRSMEFLISQESQVITYNRGEKFESTAPDGTKGLEWTSKYGFTGMTAFHLNGVDEGMNEEGLSFGALTLEGTKYAEVPQGSENKALAMMDVGNWILGSFKTVAEVKEAINNVIIWGQFIKQMNQVPGLHIALHDAEGNNGVIEMIKGKINWHDNPNGVLTNDPELDNQLMNLCEYAELKPANGMAGLPGSWSSMDRFVRISKMVEFAELENCKEAFKAATHILNSTDVPMGCATRTIENHTFEDKTLWASIKDLTHRIFYFRPHNDMTFRAIDLTKLPLSQGTPHSRLAVQVEDPTVIDVTKQLSNAHSWPFSWPGVAEVKFEALKHAQSTTEAAKEKEEMKEEAITEMAVNQ